MDFFDSERMRLLFECLKKSLIFDAYTGEIEGMIGIEQIKENFNYVEQELHGLDWHELDRLNQQYNTMIKEITS